LSDWPEFYDSEWRISRKLRYCYECWAPIVSGERYERTAGKWDGTFSAFSVCGGCVELRDRLAAGEGYTFGQLSEEVVESGGAADAVAWKAQLMRSAMLRGVPVVDLRAAGEADTLWAWRCGGPFALAVHRPAKARILPGDLTSTRIHIVDRRNGVEP
jgi:hypothetical protein